MNVRMIVVMIGALVSRRGVHVTLRAVVTRMGRRTAWMRRAAVLGRVGRILGAERRVHRLRLSRGSTLKTKEIETVFITAGQTIKMS